MPVYAEKELIDGQKRWYIRTYVTDEYGKSKQIKRHNKNWVGREGRKEAEWEENRLKNNSYISHQQERQKNITLHELKEKYLANLSGKLDEDTIDNKRIMLNHFCEIDITKQVETFPNMDIKQYNEKMYIKFQQQMKNKKYKKGKIFKNYSIELLNRIHNTICSMVEFAILEGYCQINFAKKCGKIGTPKEIKISKTKIHYEVINYNEYQRLLDSSKDNLKYNTFFDLEFSRGPRIGEIRAFRVCDYNPEAKQLMVNHTMSKKNILKEPKTAASKATIDLDDSLNNKICQLINILKQQKDFNNEWYIFNGPTPISAHALDNAKEKYFKIAGINKHIRIHDFRHSCATWLFSLGIPIEVISRILRHANIKETMETYTHLLNDVYTNCLQTIYDCKNQNNIQEEKQVQKQVQNNYTRRLTVNL